MALGIYTLILIAITVVSGISVALLFLTKTPKQKIPCSTSFPCGTFWSLTQCNQLPMNLYQASFSAGHWDS